MEAGGRMVWRWRPTTLRCLVSTGREAIRILADTQPTVVVLDLGRPDIDGLDVCRFIRKWSQVPIIVVTADGAEDRKVSALELGADDYVTKPFSMRELLARVGVAIRHQRARAPETTTFIVGNLVVDVSHHVVTVDGERVELTPKESSTSGVCKADPSQTD